MLALKDMIEWLFYGLFFLIPLTFYPRTAEIFEFNKIVVLYIFTALIMTSWIIKMIYEKKIIFRRTFLDIPLLLFLGSQVISTFFSIDPRTSFFGYYSRFNGGLLSLICYSLLYFAYVSNFTKQNSLKLIKITLFSAALVAIYGILEHFGGSISCIIVSGKFDNECWVQDVGTRVFATLGQPNWLAAYLTSLVPLAWNFTLTTKENKTKLIWIIVSVVFFVCILFTKSRSGLLGLGVAALIFWAANLRKFRTLIIIGLLFFVAIATFGTPVTPTLSQIVNKQNLSLQNGKPVDQGEGGTESGAIREIVWKGAIDIWKHYPLFGTGVETFGFSYWQFRPIAHNYTSEWNYLYNKAHNEYLNFLSNTGILGLGSYLVLIGASFVVILRGKNKDNTLKLALVAGLISILITNFFGFSVVVISLFTFIFPAISVSLDVKPEEIKKKNLDINQKILIFVSLGFLLFILYLTGKYWYADYIYQKGNQEIQAKMYKSALTDLSLATTYFPEANYYNQMARLLAQLAVSQSEKEKTAEIQLANLAIEESDSALALSPRNMNVLQTRMGILIQLAKFNSQYLTLAVDLANRTIDISPTDPKLELILGKAYANMGRLDESITAFRKALQLKSDYDDAKKALEVVLKLKNESSTTKK